MKINYKDDKDARPDQKLNSELFSLDANILPYSAISWEAHGLASLFCSVKLAENENEHSGLLLTC